MNVPLFALVGVRVVPWSHMRWPPLRLGATYIYGCIRLSRCSHRAQRGIDFLEVHADHARAESVAGDSAGGDVPTNRLRADAVFLRGLRNGDKPALSLIGGH